MSLILKLLGVFGLIFFGLLFSLTFASPALIEASAKGFIQQQIGEELRDTQQALSESGVTAKALDLVGALGVEREQLQASIDTKLPEKIASVIATMCSYDCEKSKALAQSITTGYLERIKGIQVAESRLSDIIKGKYYEILASLKHDLRVFLGANFLVFLLLLITSFARPQAVAHLFLPAMLLVLATALSVAVYIFGQNWLYALLYNDYMGFGYLVYLAGIFGFLSDVVLNRARVTTTVINGVANALGSALSVAPC